MIQEMSPEATAEPRLAPLHLFVRTGAARCAGEKQLVQDDKGHSRPG